MRVKLVTRCGCTRLMDWNASLKCPPELIHIPLERENVSLVDTLAAPEQHWKLTLRIRRFALHTVDIVWITPEQAGPTMTELEVKEWAIAVYREV